MHWSVGTIALLAAVFVIGAAAGRALGACLDGIRLKRRLRQGQTPSLARTGSTGQFLRLTQTLEQQLEGFQRAVAERDTQLAEFRDAYEQRARELDALRTDVRDAVAKTRELREELIDRASDAAREHARLLELESRLGEELTH